jgi:cation diffusion facilitator CzcD-associated flavoprotein CzcO
VVFGTLFYQACRRWPAKMGAFLRKGVRAQGVPDDPHFTPRYHPWDQRLCLAPDADIFKALRSGKAAVVTDEIDTFTPHGVRTTSGTEIPADVVVTATGLKLVAFSSVEIVVDGEPVTASDHLVYKGMMLSGVPNIAWCVGYTNASWTLRADLTSLYVTRLLRHMRRHGYAICRPYLAADDPALAKTRPAVDLSSGYVRRAADHLPRQGATKPWYVRQNYLLDLASTRLGRVADGTMRFDRREEPARASV